MKGWALIALALAVLGLLSWGGHALWTGGYNARVAEESTAKAKAQQQTDKIAVKQSGIDRTQAAAVATHIEAVHAGTFNLEKPIYAPEPVPPPATRVPASVFPAGFSLCWNAASTRDPQQAAACVAVREHGQVPGDTQHGPN